MNVEYVKLIKIPANPFNIVKILFTLSNHLILNKPFRCFSVFPNS